ncbi:MAG: hypothetical protein HQL60_04420 [Magnetococcales bacterium]|nr:hypothetical protein [Magnetococcales bacterium]
MTMITPEPRKQTPDDQKILLAGARNREQGSMMASVWVNGITWVLLMVVLVMVERASPQVEDLFSRVFHAKLRTQWDVSLIRNATMLAACAASVSFGWVMFNIWRNRGQVRSGDVLSILLSLISLAGVAVLFYMF